MIKENKRILLIPSGLNYSRTIVENMVDDHKMVFQTDLETLRKELSLHDQYDLLVVEICTKNQTGDMKEFNSLSGVEKLREKFKGIIVGISVSKGLLSHMKKAGCNHVFYKWGSNQRFKKSNYFAV